MPSDTPLRRPHRDPNEPRPAEERQLNRGILDGMVAYHLRRAQLAAFQSFPEFVADPEVTPGRFGVLALISANPGINQTVLAQTLGIDRSTMVALIDWLEGRGLVMREPLAGDRRAYALRLTASGEDFLAELRRRVERHEQALAAALTPEERKQLLVLLRKLPKG